MSTLNVICEVCGSAFHAGPKRSKQARFCSRKCRLNLEYYFWRKVQKSDGCWEWAGSVDRKGYGKYHDRRNGQLRIISAHRYSYELAYGPFDRSLFVLHRCDNPACVRPDHLFLGTALDNMQDMIKKGRHAEQRKPKKQRKPNRVMPRGEKHHMSKLSDAQRCDISARYRIGGISQKQLADAYGVSTHAVAIAIRDY